MWRFTCLPRNVYDFLYPFKPLFHCAQARHFVIFCCLLVAIIRDPGVGTLKGALPYVPAGLSYWALLRMLRSGQWDAQAVLCGMSKKVLRRLPPPARFASSPAAWVYQRTEGHPLFMVQVVDYLAQHGGLQAGAAEALGDAVEREIPQGLQEAKALLVVLR
jgi:hypothetical protein